MTKIHPILFILLTAVFCTQCSKPENPGITSIDPVFGPAGTLVTIQGENMADIVQIKFSDQIVNFNTAYNADHALLMRIPESVPLGDHIVSIETEGGIATTEFKVTLDPPEIFRFEPESADVGEEVVIYGQNFFEPLEVYFFDSIQAEITSFHEDSIIVVVPEGIERGPLSVEANGGAAQSPINFFSTRSILINDFDGNGLRAETNKWIFRGFVDQNANNVLFDSDPESLDGNFAKLSGWEESWIGGFENHSWDTDIFETFGITNPGNSTLFEMDVHTNGNENTHIIIIFLERDGSPNDFTQQLKLSGDGWQKVSIPLNRFQDLNGLIVDPAKIKTVKIHLINADGVNTPLEVNIDNMEFIEIL
ncbi:MAG: glycan-binding surface protein [Bacteroidota bacterium]